MATLVSLGATVAFGYSAIATIALPGRATYYDVAALIITLIAVGKYLELAGRARAGAAIEALAELQPRTAHLLARAPSGQRGDPAAAEIGRASCRERVYISVVAVSLKKKRESMNAKRVWKEIEYKTHEESE